MNKLKTLCAALLLGVACTFTAQAQSFNWGFVAGMNLTKLKLSGSTKEVAAANLKSSNKAGWYVGPKVTFNTPLGIGADAALEYSERTLDINDETEKYRTLEIPVNIHYNIGLGSKLGIYVATGPQFGFALQNMKWGNLGTGANFSKNNLNTTWNIGVGVRALDHLEVGIGYNFALGRAGKAIWEGVGGNAGASQDVQLEYKTNTFQVQVAYIF